MPSSRAEVSQCSTYNMSRKELFHSTGRASVKETAECRYSWSWSLAADLYYMIPTMYGGRKDHQPTDKSRQFVWSCTTYLLDGFLHPLAYIECNFQFHPPLKALCVAKIKLHTELEQVAFRCHPVIFMDTETHLQAIIPVFRNRLNTRDETIKLNIFQ